MRKQLSVILALAMVLALLCGCQDQTPGNDIDTSDLYKQVIDCDVSSIPVSLLVVDTGILVENRKLVRF